MSDADIALKFFEMLKRNGVRIEKTDDGGPGWKILDTISDKETLEFCFHSDGAYWRIMGYLGEYYSDEIHKAGWLDSSMKSDND